MPKGIFSNPLPDRISPFFRSVPKIAYWLDSIIKTCDFHETFWLMMLGMIPLIWMNLHSFQ
ncbi:MAG: hypothetical protein CSA50_07750 [Gammaproteobacteria bacterium]|nr:MAG: hypothetical protein CSA50_07750 [Gammaproteobacteria bacterium]